MFKDPSEIALVIEGGLEAKLHELGYHPIRSDTNKAAPYGVSCGKEAWLFPQQFLDVFYLKLNFVGPKTPSVVKLMETIGTDYKVYPLDDETGPGFAIVGKK